MNRAADVVIGSTTQVPDIRGLLVKFSQFPIEQSWEPELPGWLELVWDCHRDGALQNEASAVLSPQAAFPCELPTILGGRGASRRASTKESRRGYS